VGSNLGSIALISERLGRNESLSQMIKDELTIITETSRQTSEFLRDIVWYINPRYDTFMNLEARLREISGRMLRDVDVEILMGTDNRPDEKFIESRRNIILMFKEILHNIIKHSKAMKIVIRCERNTNSFLLSVKDNGVGFDQKLVVNGNGLRSIKLRAEEVGAQLKIMSQLGEGTEVTMIFKTNVNTL
jgi:signal transduction histidine kinase